MMYVTLDSKGGKCPICWVFIQPKKGVYHLDDPLAKDKKVLGKKHPFHRTCARLVALTKNTCPVCNVNIDTNSIFTWQDKCIIELKHLGIEAFCFSGNYGISIMIATGGNLEHGLGTAPGGNNIIPIAITATTLGFLAPETIKGIGIMTSGILAGTVGIGIVGFRAGVLTEVADLFTLKIGIALCGGFLSRTYGVKPTARKIVKIMAAICGAVVGAGAVEEIAGGAGLTVIAVTALGGALGVLGGGLIKRQILGYDPFGRI